MPLDARRPENADRELCPCLLQLHPLLYFTFLFCLIDFVCIFFFPCVSFIGVSRRKKYCSLAIETPIGLTLGRRLNSGTTISRCKCVSGMKKKKRKKEKEKKGHVIDSGYFLGIPTSAYRMENIFLSRSTKKGH
jgi:hypothetical protein